MSEVSENIDRIRKRVAAAAARAGRNPAEVRIMGVTKTVSDERIREAIAAGIEIFGENYVQEAKRKIELMGKSVEWHLIGHLQTNKAKYAVRLFDMIHSVNRLSLAEELNRRAAAAGISNSAVTSSKPTTCIASATTSASATVSRNFTAPVGTPSTRARSSCTVVASSERHE